MKTKMFRQWLPFLLLASVSILAGCGAKGGSSNVAEFKLNLEKGKKFVTSMKMVQQIETSMGGQSMNIDQTMIFDFDMEVVDKTAAGNTVIKNSYKRVYLKQSMPGMGGMGDTEIDTQDSTKNKGMMAATMSGAFSKFIGKSFETEQDVHGKVVRTTMNQLMKEVTGQEESGTMQDWSGYSVAFPDKPIKVGESWDSEISTSVQGMNVVTKTKYTLKAIKDGVAEVYMEGNITSNGTDGEGVAAKMDGKQTGTSYIELSTGMTQSLKLDQDFTMEVSQMGQSIPMKVKGTIEMTSK